MRLLLTIWLALSAVAELAAAFPTAIVEDYTDPEFPAAKLVALGLKTKTSTMT